MLSPTTQGFQGSDLPISLPASAPSSTYSQNRTARTGAFSDLLERASAQETHRDQQSREVQNRQDVQHPQGTEADSEQGGERTAPAAPAQHNTQADHAPTKQTAQAGVQDSMQKTTATRDAASNDPAKKSDPVQSSQTEEAHKDDAAAISATSSGDDVKVPLQELPAELLSALLAAIQDKIDAARCASNGTADRQDDSAQDNSTDAESTTISLQGKQEDLDKQCNDEKIALKIQLDAGDATKEMQQLLSLAQAIAAALQGKASNTADFNAAESEARNLTLSEKNSSGVLADSLLKEAGHAKGSVSTGATPVFKNLLPDVNSSNSPSATDQPGDQADPTLLFNSTPDGKVAKIIDPVDSILAKLKATVSVAGVAKEVNGTPESVADLPTAGNNGGKNLTPESAWVQVSLQQGPPAEVSNSTSFGSIVTDRMAAVADQIEFREKPSDVTLRLRTENGDSLMIGLKNQAGQIVVQVKSADKNMVGFLESQKETIVRNLEAKQVSSTISVRPIEEDLARRQDRQQQRNSWGRRREPSNPNIETLT